MADGGATSSVSRTSTGSEKGVKVRSWYLTVKEGDIREKFDTGKEEGETLEGTGPETSTTRCRHRRMVRDEDQNGELLTER